MVWRYFCHTEVCFLNGCTLNDLQSRNRGIDHVVLNDNKWPKLIKVDVHFKSSLAQLVMTYFHMLGSCIINIDSEDKNQSNGLPDTDAEFTTLGHEEHHSTKEPSFETCEHYMNLSYASDINIGSLVKTSFKDHFNVLPDIDAYFKILAYFMIIAYFKIVEHAGLISTKDSSSATCEHNYDIFISYAETDFKLRSWMKTTFKEHFKVARCFTYKFIYIPKPRIIRCWTSFSMVTNEDHFNVWLEAFEISIQ